MKSIQANNTFFLPCINGSNPRKSELLFPSYPYLVCFNAKVPVTKKLIASSSLWSQQFAPLLKHKRCVSISKCRPGTTVCKFGGQDKPAGDNEVDSTLRREYRGGSSQITFCHLVPIEKQDYYDEGSGQNPPRGGGGGSSGGGDGFGESEDEGLFGILDETVQVILATFGFIFLYVYIITSEELARLAKDYIKYLFEGSKSVRLKRTMYKWSQFFEKLTEKKDYDKFWLEKAIITTRHGTIAPTSTEGSSILI
ncbi:hypothetical protein ES332_D13G204600v1 [Gossypium tomentosum]|uniref:Uncharacterized protein n=1 Tax=Gossypium tomentosum TaxID=34277 RepID=A0A5D2HZS6_GOSTO|nr:hypothetical protein ES332_D13G204600v1 [Gossypium tomentosum]